MKTCQYCGYANVADDAGLCPECHELAPGLANVQQSAPAVTFVKIVDVEIPFGSMVVLMLKWAFAAIPALFILGWIGFFVGLFFGVFLGGLR